MPSTKGGVRQIWRWLDAGAGNGGTDMLTLSKCITDVLQAVMCLEPHNNGSKYNNSGVARAIRGRSRCINGVRNPGGRAKGRGGGAGSRTWTGRCRESEAGGLGGTAAAATEGSLKSSSRRTVA